MVWPTKVKFEFGNCSTWGQWEWEDESSIFLFRRPKKGCV